MRACLDEITSYLTLSQADSAWQGLDVDLADLIGRLGDYVESLSDPQDA